MISRLVRSLLHASDRLSYRRLLAWATATGLLLAGRLGEQGWLLVTGIFVASEVAERIVAGRAPPALSDRP